MRPFVVLCLCFSLFFPRQKKGVRACYDEGKRVAETLFFDFHRQHNIEVRVARIFNTFGPGMHPYGEAKEQRRRRTCLPDYAACVGLSFLRGCVSSPEVMDLGRTGFRAVGRREWSVFAFCPYLWSSFG